MADLREKCATPASLLRDVVSAMADEMCAGLEKEGGSRVKMLLSYVDKLPTGLVSMYSSSCFLSVCLITGSVGISVLVFMLPENVSLFTLDSQFLCHILLRRK